MANGSIDYGSEKLAVHTFTEGGEERNTERISPGAGVLTFDWANAVDITAIGMISTLTCVVEGCGRIVVMAKSAGAAGLTFTFRVVFYSALTPTAATVIGTSALVTSALTSVDDGGAPAKRYSPAAVFANDVGAKSARVYMEAITSNGAMTIGMGAF